MNKQAKKYELISKISIGPFGGQWYERKF